MKHYCNDECIRLADDSFSEEKTSAESLPGRSRFFDNQANPRILIVEDCEDTREFIKLFFPYAGEIVEAENGREALERVQEEGDFHLIICDIEMPEVDGMQFFERVLKLDPTIRNRFLVLSGHVDDYMELLIYFDLQWIRKPLTIEALHHKIEMMLPHLQMPCIAGF